MGRLEGEKDYGEVKYKVRRFTKFKVLLIVTAFFFVLSIITPPSGRGLVIPVFYPAVRTGSSNTRFSFFLSSWSLAPDLRSVKTILAGNVRSFSVYSPEFS